jgi:hypothetical protein
MIEQLAALATLRFNWADTPDDVWQDSPYHVDGLHAEAVAAIEVAVGDARDSTGSSPIGLVLQGQKGVGKTHLFGLVRRQVHLMDGYFFLNDLAAGDAFWENTAESLRRGLSRGDQSGESQLTRFLRRVCLSGGVDSRVTETIVSGRGLTRKDVDAFVAGLRALDRQVAVECSDTARAMVLYARDNTDVSYVGECYLGGFDESRNGERRKWGIRPTPKSALTQVHDITRLLALTGPLVIGVDQLDTLIAQSMLQGRNIGDDHTEDLLVAQIADGLMRLREVTRRTVTVLACLPNTWTRIKTKAADTVPDRFRESVILGRITDGRLGRALVEQRLGVAYEAMGFQPEHPTWPLSASAFESGWEEQTPRELWKNISAHIDTCLSAGDVRELTTFAADHGPRPKDEVHPVPVAEHAVQDRFADLDRQFEDLRSSADIERLQDASVEDEVIPALFSAALLSWITEAGNDRMEWERGPNDSDNEVHATLAHTLDEASDLKEYWVFRMISAPHHISVLSRLRKAKSAALLRVGIDNRHLILVRNQKWSSGQKTIAEIASFEAAGGRRCKIPESDLRTFWALSQLWGRENPELLEWLVDRRPASRSELLSAVLPNVATRSPMDRTRPPPGAEDAITMGTAGNGEPVTVELAALRQHVAVFAGSGSGKTVLLRRIVEECALRGVSAIVLDLNNDLARLGDPWPQPPSGWGPDDAALAGRYLAETDVVIWTPGRATGRPLAFRPLPDFAGIVGDEDEFSAAVEVAVATLAPQVRLAGSTVRVNIRLAVLKQAIIHYARAGSRALSGLVDVLADLPDGVSTLNDSRRIAAELAEALKAAMVNDPLLAGGGEPVDPGLLITPDVGKRARVSVISFVGLPAEEQRRNFVNQLHMELFAWIKRNPAGDRPLGALYVMDEAQTLAGSGSLTASTRSTIVLASQARKYGLGLVFATQAPKGLHNQIVGNAMTQFFGRLNSNAQIAAANDLARAKGTAVVDISRLERAEFYLSGEAFGFHKITTPLCLSHHPASPLRPEEVIDRARRNGSPR